jgi:ribonuclease J
LHVAEPVRLVFLGGLGEIGRNCMAVEEGAGDARRILLIDCGLMFPGADLHGIDLVLPDFTYLRENAERIEALVATHGHEDHVGGIPFLLREISFPIYGSAVTLGLARNRIEEAGLLGRTALHVVADGERRRIGSFDVEFIPVTHSVPHSHGIAVHTSQGVILHSGDFKLDLTPVDDRRTDLARIGELARTVGIRVLLADSTNAEEAGHAPSERMVGGVLRSLFAEHRDRRIVTASFASHLHRIQQIADASIESGRRIATLGLSMRKNVQMGIDLGVLSIPASSLIDIEDIDVHPPGAICVISTGSQGEPMSALALLARGENKYVKLCEHDTVILSSHAIPGNESNVNRVMDGLLRAGAEVVHSGIQDVHATGHAQADELKTYLSIAQPEWYVPVHGEFRHLVANARLGEVMGLPRDQVFVCENGDVLNVTDGGVEMAGRVPAGYLYVDGIVGDVGTGVLRDRRMLASEGVVVVVVTVDTQTGKVLVGPEIITRGWVYAPEAEDLLDEACDTIAAAVEVSLAEGVRDVEALERDVRRAAGRFVSERTRRRPMIVPVVMEA